MGIRFQHEPQAAPSEIVIHVRMWDRENLLQQQALGIVGVNLIYGAFQYRQDPARLVQSLVDLVGSERVEVDMLQFTGPAFPQVDNRLLALHLVQLGLTNAVMFDPSGQVLQPSEALYKKPVLVERGNFRPVTHVHVDMLSRASAQFVQEPTVQGKEIVVLMEITMNNLLSSGQLDAEDFLARVDMLGHIGYTTLISNYPEYFRLVSYFRRYTKEMIGLALGVHNLLELFNERYCESLEGGVLESMGRMFRHAVRLYAYPMRPDYFARFQAIADPGRSFPPHSAGSGDIVTAENLQVPARLRHLYSHLLENRFIVCVDGHDQRCLDIFSRDVLEKMKAGDASWETQVPPRVADLIRRRRLFGWAPLPPATT